MGLHADDLPANLESLSDGALTALLKSAEGEERSVSFRRTVLQGRIEDSRARSGTALPEFDPEQLSALQEEERVLSRRRLQLHQTIIDLRVERSSRIDRLRLLPSPLE